MTQQELASRIDLSVNQISLIENGKSWVGCWRLDRLASALDADLMEFFIEGSREKAMETLRRKIASESLSTVLDALGRELGIEISVKDDPDNRI